MKNIGFRMKIAILTSILVFLGFFGAYRLFISYNIVQPLIKHVNALSEVEKATVKENNRQYKITVYLKQGQNLQYSYKQIDQIVGQKLNSDSYKIEIKDKRDSKLNNFYDYTQLASFEAMNNDQFLWLNRILQEKAQKSGIKCKLQVDQERIYIQVDDGNYYMYDIINRTSQNQKAANGEGEVS